MKIVFERLHDDRSYPITQREIKLLFSLLPDLWRSDVDFITVSLTQFVSATYSEVSKRLKVYCYESDKRATAYAIVWELARKSYPNLNKRPLHHLLPKEKTRLKAIIKPYVDQFMEQRETVQPGAPANAHPRLRAGVCG